jgi:uncharacterized protein involved in propanediol utilization
MTSYGRSFGSFGEIVQGRFSNGQDFLCTMPVDMWSECAIRPMAGLRGIECDMPKTRDALALMLAGREISVRVTLNRNIPIGKGIGSSTADILAAIRAASDMFKMHMTPVGISNIMTAIEPHDALHYGHSVLYDHRQGTLIRDYGYIPQWWIIGVDSGGQKDTITYNRDLTYTKDDMRRYDDLVARLDRAFGTRDDAEIAQCASESALIHAKTSGNLFIRDALIVCRRVGALGVIATHSGTCAGLLIPPERTYGEIVRTLDTVNFLMGGRATLITRSLSLGGPYARATSAEDRQGDTHSATRLDHAVSA